MKRANHLCGADSRPRIHMRPDGNDVAWARGPIGVHGERNLTPTFGDALNDAIVMYNLSEAVVILQLAEDGR